MKSKKKLKLSSKKQNKDGGWPLFFDGDSDISASVKAYFALKLAGLDEKCCNETYKKIYT